MHGPAGSPTACGRHETLDMGSEFKQYGDGESKALVVFSSMAGVQANGMLEKGNTAVLAEIIAEEAGADLFELVSADGHYPADYRKLEGIAQADLAMEARPPYAGDVPDFGKYDTVLMGGPAWYMRWPMINYTFLDGHDLVGKTLAPFATYVGSGLRGIDAHLAAAYPEAKAARGLAVKGADAQAATGAVRASVTRWLDGLGLRR